MSKTTMSDAIIAEAGAHADREHSDLVGGSSAEKRINCPGSYQMEQKLPPSDARESSKDADEGTALHECMQYILENNIVDLDTVLGMSFGVSDSSPAGYVITKKLMEDAIIPCVEFFDMLDDRAQAEGGMDFLVEQRCQLPGIPGAFGTSDLICRTDKRTFIVDWKFGVNVPVKAAYVETDNDGFEHTRGNSQLMFYARAAQHTRPEMFENDPKHIVELYIVQPRSRFNEGEEIYTRHVTNIKELEEFRIQLVKAVAEAKGKDPRVVKGDWCRFAKCKKICPHFTQPGFALTQMADKLRKRESEPLGNVAVDWSALYSELLDYCVLAELAVKEIRAGAHAFLETGEKIPNWKLVDKRGTEVYIDEQGAVRHAIGLGVEESQCFEMSTKTPAQLRELMAPFMPGSTKKARTEAAQADLRKKFTKVVSSGTTLAPDDDKRAEAITASATISSLSERLAALTGQ